MVFSACCLEMSNSQPNQPNLKTLTFEKIIQGDGEDFDDFLTRLQGQSDRLLLDNIIAGIRSDLVRKELLSDAGLTLERTIQVCRDSELASKQIKKHVVLNQISCSSTTEPGTNKKTLNRKRKCEETVRDFMITLDTINEDCLRQIYRFLNILDAVALAATCSRLLNFANSAIFPKKAKQLNIVCDDDIKFNLNNTMALPLKDINKVLRYCGESAEDLALDSYTTWVYKIDLIIWPKFVIMIKQCENLVKLSLSSFDLSLKNVHQLQDIIESLQHLKEFDFTRCYGITSEWRAAKGISKVVKLKFSICKADVTDNFLNYFKNLSSLSINFNFERDNQWHPEYLAQIFNNNRQLQHLKLLELHLMDNESIGTLITKKLSKLDSLELELVITDKTKYMIALPHLKSLKLYGEIWSGSMNSYLRTHSDIGIIEELIIFSGVFDDAANEPPLNFKKLRRFGWDLTKWPGFLKLMIRSQWPEIQNICCRYVKTDDFEDLLKFVKAKKTLKLIQIYIEVLVPSAFWIQLIGILKEPSTPRRPFLKLVLSQLCLGEQDNELLDANRNLFNAEQDAYFGYC